MRRMPAKKGKAEVGGWSCLVYVGGYVEKANVVHSRVWKAKGVLACRE